MARKKTKVSSEQVDDWRDQLTLAMANQQWRRALQLCSWLRYALEKDPDPEIEQLHRRAKESLAKQVAQERAQQAQESEHRRLRHTVTTHIAAGTWMKAFDALEALYKSSADRQELLGFLRELKIRLSDRLLPTHWEMDPTASTLARRFDELLAEAREDV
jgi:hypothetical protein